MGESGLLTRLMIPLVAAIGKGIVTIEGRGTLLNRPLKGASDIMSQFGTVLRPLGDDARAGVVKVPLMSNLQMLFSYLNLFIGLCSFI